MQELDVLSLRKVFVWNEILWVAFENAPMQIPHVYEYNETNITTDNNSLGSTIPNDLMELNLTSLDLSEYLIEESVCNF